MDLSYEGLLTTLIFLLPGFFVYHSRRYFQPAYADEPDNFELSLLSLGYGTVIFVIQATLCALVLSLWGFSLSALFADPRQYIIDYPLYTLILMSVWVLCSLALALIVGAKDPYMRLLARARGNEVHGDEDIWHRVFYLQRKCINETAEVGATVLMANGDIYTSDLSLS